jgi:hypothetical protein
MAAEAEGVSLDSPTQILEMVEHFPGGFVSEEDGEFFSAYAKCLSAASDAREVRRDHAQHFVSDFVAIGVIDTFEVIDIHRSHGVGSL